MTDHYPAGEWQHVEPEPGCARGINGATSSEREPEMSTSAAASSRRREWWPSSSDLLINSLALIADEVA